MIIKTRIFELCNGNYENLSELARAMGISVSQIYRVKEGKRSINQKFIIGASKAFPKYKLSDLFYLAPESPTVTKEKQQALEEFTSATNEYSQHLTSHTSAIINLNEAALELRKGVLMAKEVLKRFQDIPPLESKAVETSAVPLTPRELEILSYAARGWGNKQIAYKLFISEQTIKNHMTSVLSKLNASDRTQAVVLAMHYGWISS